MIAVPPEILRSLRDPRAAPRPLDAEAHAAALLRGHALREISRAVSAAGLSALLVKGAALALDAYPDPASRPMSDIDLLVRRADRDGVVAALARAGGETHTPRGRPYSAELLWETQIMLPAGATWTRVEVHTSLDKLAARPVDEAGLFGRARGAPGLPGLLVPAPEDHALLIALHAAGDGLRHPIAFLDLEVLLRRGLDAGALAARARAWRLRTVMFAVLSAMRELGAASVPDELVRAFDPGPLRRAALGAVDREDPRLGLRWVLRQTPFRDDLGAWALGVGRYAAARAADALASPPAPVHDAGVISRDGAAGTPFRVPLWVRALLLVDRAALKAENLHDGLRDEVLLAWIRPEDRSALTAALYADQSAYLPGGNRFESGLFAWEKRVLDAPTFPRSGRVLVGAAGAGREVKALLERGYEVVAFDPCIPFVEAARSIGPRERVTVVQAAYADLLAATVGEGPLAGPCSGPPFDAVVLGWGSLSHVMPAAERTALLRALRALAPRAPVLASFALAPEVARPVPGKGRVRDGLRRLFGLMGAPGSSEVGDHFFPNAGFFSYLGRDELADLARSAGYDVAIFEETPYPHALLVPAGAPP